jgi:hypothetical protein
MESIAMARSGRRLPAQTYRNLILAAVILVGTTGIVWLASLRPFAILRVTTGPLRGDRAWTVLNPLRDRLPERCAESFLARLRAGSCDPASPVIADSPAEGASVCEREGIHRLESWHIENGEKQGSVVLLSYRGKRAGRSDTSLFVWLRQQHNNWEVSLYRSVY